MTGRVDLAADAVEIAAKKTGLRADQIERAVAEYRAAADALHEEPEWQAIHHMSGKKEAFALYGSTETRVELSIPRAERPKRLGAGALIHLPAPPLSQLRRGSYS